MIAYPAPTENVSRLKELQYLNLALNNVTVIEGLEGARNVIARPAIDILNLVLTLLPFSLILVW